MTMSDISLPGLSGGPGIPGTNIKGSGGMSAVLLSYSDMTTDHLGRIVPRETKEALRKQYGFCLTCPDIPVPLYYIKKSRLNPLWSQKHTLTVEGQSHNGCCLKCKKRNEEKLPVAIAEDTMLSSADTTRQTHHSLKSNRRRSSFSAELAKTPSSGSVQRDIRRLNISMRELSSSSLLSEVSVGTSGPECGTQGATAAVPPHIVSASTHSAPSASASSNGLERHSQHLRSGHGGFRRMSVQHIPQMAPSPHNPSIRHGGHGAPPMLRTSRSSSGSSRGSSTVDGWGNNANGGAPSIMPLQQHGNSIRPSPPPRSRSSDGLMVFDDDCFEDEEIVSSARRFQSRRPSMCATVRSLPTSTPVAISPSGGGGVGGGRRALRRSSYAPGMHRSRVAGGGGGMGLDGVDPRILRESTHQQIEDQTIGETEEYNPPEERKYEAPDMYEELEKFFLDLKASGFAEVLTESLIHAMDSHADNERAQLCCLRVACDIYERGHFDSAALVAADGHERILAAMKNFPLSLELQQRGCAAIGAISNSNDDGSNVDALINAGACVAVERAVTRFLGDGSLVACAFGALRALSLEARGRESCELLYRPVVESMYCHPSNEVIQAEGCLLLSSLATERKHVSTVNLDTLDVIVRAMMNHKDGPVVLTNACVALKVLTSAPPNLRSLARVEDGIAALHNATRFDCVDDANLVLEMILVSRAQDESLEEGAVRSLEMTIEQLEDIPDFLDDIQAILNTFTWSGRVTAACLRAFRLAANSETHSSKLRMKLTRTQVVAYSKAYRSNASVQREALELIKAMEELESSNHLDSSHSLGMSNHSIEAVPPSHRSLAGSSGSLGGLV